MILVPGEWLTVQEAADHLGVARATIYKWARKGRLPIYKLGEKTSRVKASDLERLLNEARTLYEAKPDTAAAQRLLAKTKGLWRNSPEIDEALAEIDRAWRKWRPES